MFRLAVVMFVAAMTVFGADSRIDPRAAELLRKVTAQVQSAKTAEMDLRLEALLKSEAAPKDNISMRYGLSIERPNKIALVLKEGTMGATAISDGVTATTFIPTLKIYTVHPAPRDIGGLEYDAESPTGDMGSMAFIAALFSADPYKALMNGVAEATHAGRAKIGETECERVNFKQEGLEWTLFSTTETPPLVRQIVVTIPQLRMTMDFTDWKLNASIPAERFKFSPPAGSKKVEKLFDDSDPDAEGEDSELIGETLPALKLKTLEGGSFDTATLRGAPSILVVWTGEAAHCISALRTSLELSGARKANFYSINIDEKPDAARIKTFLGKEQLNVKTALDAHRTAVDKLAVEGVPMTFLVDKAGVVRKAFLGYHPDFKELVGKELDALVR